MIKFEMVVLTMRDNIDVPVGYICNLLLEC
jgi:hypothetical protein